MFNSAELLQIHEQKNVNWKVINDINWQSAVIKMLGICK